MKKILLVDDSRAIRMASRRMLNDCSLEVLEAENGREGLDAIHANPDVDAVLLDWNMPIMDGYSMLQAIRGDATAPQPLILMCTTENEVPKIMSALQAGANEYIMKPFTEDIIREKLSSLGVL